MRNIELIKASAGSGKTTELMKRLSRYIEEGTPPEGLLATTFTVKAAAELQSRIRRMLLEKSRPDLASRVFDGLIGTVNSVCGRLLNEYAIEAKLPPALDVLPEGNAGAIFNAAVSEVMDRYAGKLEEAAARLSMNPIRDDRFSETSDWKKDVRNIVNLARSNRLDKAALEECGDRAVKELKPIFPATVDLSLEDIRNRVSPYRNFPGEGTATRETVAKIKSFLRFPTWAGALQLGKAKCAEKDDPTSEVTDILRPIGEQLICSKELHADMCAMISGVFECAGEALDAYARYKKDLGLVDFVDQESGVLELLENNPGFVRLMEQRLSRVMVDEFQDTSPIQLALFLKLNECSQNGSVWVGDPKQAIYGFRGTDPELMEAVAAEIPGYSTLPESWRSKEILVKLANDIFTRAFSPAMKKEDVMLSIPAKRKEEARGGTIEAWHLRGKNKKEYSKALAAGIATLIRDRHVTPNRICVLLRKNEECRDLAEALAVWNISASAPSGLLLETPECQLVMSAFRYCVDPQDTVALATLLALYGQTPGWLDKLHAAKAAWLDLSDEERKKTDFLAEFRNVGFLRKLRERRQPDSTPMEILEFVITALDLDGKISAMSSPDRRLSNVEELRRVCAEYMEQALAERRAATASGFVAALAAGEAKQAEGFGSNTVNVMTYHQSKGLEWPIVILGSLDSEEKGGAFGIRAGQKKEEEFDVNSPLRGRTIHYWPWPFGASKKLEALEEALSSNEIQKDARERERRERKRLFYVGLTRARDQLIFALNSTPPTQNQLKKNPAAPRTLQMGWLDSLSEVPLLTFPAEEGLGTLTVGEAGFAMTTLHLDPVENPAPLPAPAVFTDGPRDISGVRSVPAHRSPSGESCTDGRASLLRKWDYGGPVSCEEGKYALLGNAFHEFLALNPRQDRLEIAERLLKNWTVEKSVPPERLPECADNLYRWIAETWPDAKISCEIPMTYHDENGTLYQGFIDMLLELPEYFVIIDHKTHPADFDAQKYAAECAGQLRLYRKAVEAATGKSVRQTVIHFPNLGMCFEVE